MAVLPAAGTAPAATIWSGTDASGSGPVALIFNGNI